jgi:tellurite resistance protein TehA-like permease
MVMATGIVSIATQEELRGVLSAALATVAGGAWVVLLLLSGARVVRATKSVRDELKSPAAAPDFFAFVAAAGVLGVRAVIAGRYEIGLALWTVGVLAWLVLVVAVPVAIGARSHPHVPAWWAASGNWLLVVVATQSLAVLAGGLAGAGWPHALLLVALCCWVLGLALYAALIAAIGVRVLSSQPPPARFTPDDWIIMGALAISALAATGLLRAERASQFSHLAHTLVAHAGAVTWALASAAVTPLAFLQVRRLLRDRAARRYQARWWAAVFPLGMYSVATHQLAVTLGWHPLEPVARTVFWLALLAWSVTAAAAIGSPLRSNRSPAGRRQSEQHGSAGPRWRSTESRGGR